MPSRTLVLLSAFACLLLTAPPLAVAQDKAPGPVEEGEVVTVHFASAF